MEKVQKVRDLERNAKESVKNVNCLIEIRQVCIISMTAGFIA